MSMGRFFSTTAALAFSASTAVAGGLVETPTEAPAEILVIAPEAPTGNWYGTLNLGYVFQGTASGTGEIGSSQQDLDFDHDAGYGYGAAFGYEMQSGLRLELEALMLHGDLTDLTASVASNGNAIPAPGDFSITAGFANAWYSFGGGALRPFIGGGLGTASVTIDVDDTDPPNGFSSTDTSMAWQIGAGVDYALTDTMDFTVSYRVINIDDIEGTDGDGDDFSTDYQNHIVTAGIRFSF